MRPSIVEFTGDKDLDLLPKNSQQQKRAFCLRTTIDSHLNSLNSKWIKSKKTQMSCFK